MLLELIKNELEILTPKIKKLIETKFPNFTNDSEVIRWIEINGLNKNKDILNKISKLVSFALILKLIIKESTNPSVGLSESNEQYDSNELLSLNEFNFNKTEMINTSLLKRLINEIPKSLHPSSEIIRKILVELRKSSEDISDIYYAIITQEERRKMGQFNTPSHIAELMVDWTLREPSDKLFDLGTGSGIFLLKGIQRLESLGQKKESIKNNLFGIELGFIPYLMCKANLVAHLPNPNNNLINKDFLTIKPPFNRFFKVKTLDDFYISENNPTFDAIVSNPPYTRHHLLPQFYKKDILSAFKEIYGVKLSRFSSLFTYFILHALSFLKKGGRLAVISPTIVFESRNSQTLKKFLIKNLRIKALLTFSEDLVIFKGVDTAACITLIENLPADNQKVILLEINKWPGKEQILQTINNDKPEVLDWGKKRIISSKELDHEINWTTLVRNNKVQESSKFTQLGKLSFIIRGIATGANDFFTLTDEEVEKTGINSSFFKPVITKTRYIQGYNIDNITFNKLREDKRKSWLLYITNEDEFNKRGDKLTNYIKIGEKRGLHKRSLVRKRRRWFLMEKRDVPTILYTYLSRKRARFIYNKAGLLALNVFLMITPIPSISNDEVTLKAFLAILNSKIVRENLRNVGRSYGADTIKVEPKELYKTKVIDPRELNLEFKKELSALFDLLCEYANTKKEEQIKKKIDSCLLKFLK